MKCHKCRFWKCFSMLKKCQTQQYKLGGSAKMSRPSQPTDYGCT